LTFSYVWKRAPDLPSMAPPFEKHRVDYERHLEDKNVRGTMRGLTNDVGLVGRLLAPLGRHI
jgi:hypothetical protein